MYNLDLDIAFVQRSGALETFPRHLSTIYTNITDRQNVEADFDLYWHWLIHNHTNHHNNLMLAI
jgi:hypothetical protein